VSQAARPAEPGTGALGTGAELDELRASVARFLADRSPMTAVRGLMETGEGYDPAVWAQLAGELGLTGLAIPEEYGGAGFSFAELAAALEETGAALLCAPLLASAALAAGAILAAGDPGACRELLPGIASGDVIATLAVAQDDGRWDVGGTGLSAAPAPGVPAGGGGWVLSGHKSFVIDGQLAGLIVVSARTADGVHHGRHEAGAR